MFPLAFTSTSPAVMAIPALPFDILFDVFSLYEETTNSPLESLLLVSRAWRDAALNHPDIWSKFKLTVKNARSALLWSRQVPRRLEKSRSTSPISFSWHRNAYDVTCSPARISRCPTVVTGNCHCKETIFVCEQIVLRAIAGPDGSLCARWQEIDVWTKGGGFSDGFAFFSHPTP